MISMRQYELAIRPLPDAETEAMLRATLAASDHGILLTALDRTILAVNRRFGELLGMDPAEIITLGLEPLRARVQPDVINTDVWLATNNNLDENQTLEFDDEVELSRNGRLILNRHSSPVYSPSGDLIGRLWTYRDITRECRQREIHEILLRISSEFIPNPDASMRRILKEITQFYGGSPCILSLRRDSYMDFRMIENAPIQLTGVPGNDLSAAYCQFIFGASAPLVIQDASLIPEASCLPAAMGGYVRYLGAPVYGDATEPIGTLCIMDQRSKEPLDDLDIHFMSLAATRVAAELARERYIEERIAEQRHQIERQREDLAAINAVLESMHSACSLLWDCEDLDSLLQNQALHLCNILTYRGSAVALRRSGESTFRGFVVDQANHPARPFVIDQDHGIDYVAAQAIAELENAAHPLAKKLKAKSVAYAIRNEDGVGEILIAFGGPESALAEEKSRILLKSLSDQVSLLMGTHVLQSDLLHTNLKLGEAEQQLLQREKLAVVGTLAATTAHDIRNILASLSMLLSPNIEPDAAGLTAIREQIRRFDVLAHRLLSYAKPRLVARQPVDLAKLLDSVLAITAGQFRVHEVQLEQTLPTGLSSLAGDPHEYEHLFVNLILNGIQAMSSGGGTLSLTAEETENEVVVKVSDTGRGLPPEIQDRLFEPFASSRADGFGLGLYSCRRIVEYHGGTIAARNNTGQGSTFTVKLPVYRA